MITMPLKLAKSPVSGTPTILCIDDDVEFVDAIKLRLRRFDVNFLGAFDGMEGFGVAMEQRTDAILLDLDMPCCDGMTMLEYFRLDAITRDTPIIIVTGVRDPILEQKLIGMGANYFLQKPIAFSELIHLLSRFIALRERTL